MSTGRMSVLPTSLRFCGKLHCQPICSASAAAQTRRSPGVMITSSLVMSCMLPLVPRIVNYHHTALHASHSGHQLVHGVANGHRERVVIVGGGFEDALGHADQ